MSERSTPAMQVMSESDFRISIRAAVRAALKAAEAEFDSNSRKIEIPWHMATGNYEKLSDLQIREALNDLAAEQQRRNNHEPTGYDPFDSQIRRSES